MNHRLDFLADGGEMGERIRARDWSETALGAPETWPQALRTAVRLLLNTGHPMYVFWGSELSCFYNDAYRTSIGPERHPSSLGQPAREVWGEIWPVIGPQIDQVMKGRGATWHENQLIPITRNGRREDVYWTYSYGPIDDPSAPRGVGGVLVVCTETTQTVLTAKRRAEEAERQRRVFEQAPGFIIVMQGPEHVVEFVNDAHRRQFGSKDWVGKPIRAAFPDIAQQGFFELLDSVFAKGEPFTAHSAPVRFRRPGDGQLETRFLDFVYAPLQGEGGLVTGIFCEGFDVTDQRDAETALRAREEQLRLATDAAEVGLWDVDLVTDRLFWPPLVKGMFGISPEAPVSMRDFYSGLHPQDRERVTASFAAAADPARRALYNEEYRTIGKEDGVLRWVAARGRGVFDQDGHCLRVIGTAIDITARKLTEEALRQSRARLEESDRRKGEFLAILSHELRNPLAPIRNSLYLLEHVPPDSDAALRARAVLHRQTTQLSRLVDDLLDVTRISRGKILLQQSRLDLREVVQSTADDARSLFEQSGVELRLEYSAGAVPVYGDPTRLAQVLSNLLQNAVKFTPRGGSVVVRTLAEEGKAIVNVADTGQGIDPSQVERIFEPFAQGEQGLARSHGGLGLGLALVKGLVEQHGGNVRASSKGPGHGSEFVFCLPLAAALPLSGDVVVARGRGSPKLVLVVEDNEDAGDTLAEVLELAGHTVHLARDGRSALAMGRALRPEVILCDIGLPGMDGYEVARAVRADPSFAATRLIALSGYAQLEDRERARSAGFDAHLGKPPDLEALHRALEEFFKRPV